MKLHLVWTLARFELRTMLKQRETLLWVFVMPLVFFYFIGAITSGFGGGSGNGIPATPILVEFPAESGFMGDHLSRRLEDSGFRPVIKDTVADPTVYTRALTIPEDFTRAVMSGVPSTVTYTTRRTGLNDAWDTFRLKRALYTVMADMAVVDSPLAADNLKRIADRPKALRVSTSRAGSVRKIPQGMSQAVPGTMVMFTLLIMLTSGAVLLVIERRQGLLRRLASAPMSRQAVVLGKWAARIGLGVIQIGFAMVVGTLVFKVTWGPHLPALGVVLLVYAAFCGALGILLGSLARTENQAILLGVVSSNVLAALGGCWWPIEITPRWMQQFSLFLPTGQAMDALHRLVSFGASPVEVLPHLAVLSAMTLAVWVFSVRVFRFH